MSFCTHGLNVKAKSGEVTIMVNASDPLIQLANLIDWTELKDLAMPDLKKTEKRLWWFGRKLKVRIHLGVMILQMLFKWTDRMTEGMIKTAPVYQIFCGLNIVLKWHCPDHTKIEKFRNRLSPETYKKIADYILKLAVKSGYANPCKLDVDSTVQEANISYPSDATLMKKLSLKCYKLLQYLLSKGIQLGKEVQIDIKRITKKSQEYFFLAKNVCQETKSKIFKEYHALVKKELYPFINALKDLPTQTLSNLQWNYRNAAWEIQEKGRRYLLDVAHFIRTLKIKSGKILSFRMEDVVCIAKGKLGKAYEFGRVFQLGRIAGNFLACYTCTSLRMNDKGSLIPVLEEHREIFGKNILESVTTDKGYYTKDNVDYVKKTTGNADGIQRPGNVKDQVKGLRKEELFNRRAGVEPLIGHAKQYGLGKSKMKSDNATLASGYRSVMGFNLHQIMRNVEGLPAA